MDHYLTINVNVQRECVIALLENVLVSFIEINLTALVQTNAELELALTRAHH